MPMTEITYGKVKGSLDFGEIIYQEGCMAIHSVSFTYKGIDYFGELMADVNLNGPIFDDELIRQVYEAK